MVSHYPLLYQYHDGVLQGQVNFIERTISIYVGEGASKEDIEDTTLHEIIHVICYHLFRNRPDCKVLLDDSIIEPFTTVLRDTLVRNKLAKLEIV